MRYDQLTGAQLLHKRADRLAAASEALHVAGSSLAEIHEDFGIAADPD